MDKNKQPIIIPDDSDNAEEAEMADAEINALMDLTQMPGPLWSVNGEPSSDGLVANDKMFSFFYHNEFLQPSNSPAQAPNPATNPMAGSLTVAAHEPIWPTASGEGIGQGSEGDKMEAHSVVTCSGAGPSNAGKKSVDNEVQMSGSSSVSGSALDPKRAKRLLSNRQSAARKREKTSKYTVELENEINTLQTQNNTKSAKIALLQKNRDILRRNNNALSSQVQQMEQKNHMKKSLQDTLRKQIYQLLNETGEVVPNSGQAGIIPFGVPHNSAPTPQIYGGPRAINKQPGNHPSLLSAQQVQQLQLSQPPCQHPHLPQPQQITIQQQQAAQAHAMMEQPAAAPYLDATSSGSGGEGATGEGAHATPDQHVDVAGRPGSAAARGEDVAGQGSE